MRLWIINLKKKKKKKNKETTRIVYSQIQTSKCYSNLKKKKKTSINSPKNIWKIQLLKLYTPSNSFAFSPPTTGEIVAEYGNIINIYLYKDLLIFGIYFKT